MRFPIQPGRLLPCGAPVKTMSYDFCQGMKVQKPLLEKGGGPLAVGGCQDKRYLTMCYTTHHHASRGPPPLLRADKNLVLHGMLTLAQRLPIQPGRLSPFRISFKGKSLSYRLCPLAPPPGELSATLTEGVACENTAIQNNFILTCHSLRHSKAVPPPELKH